MFTDTALVLTARGNVPINTVVPGDVVLTHLLRWRPVTEVTAMPAADVVTVVGGGHRGLDMTIDQALWMRRNRDPQRTRRLQEATWMRPATDAPAEMTRRWFWGSPATFPASERPWLGHANLVAALRLAGAYVADGYAVENARTGKVRYLTLTDSLSETPRLAALFNDLGIAYTLRPKSDPSNHAIVMSSLADGAAIVSRIVTMFGRLSTGKTVPAWLLGQSSELQEAFLNGYLAGDGHFDAGRGRWCSSSASKSLSIGVRLLGQSVGYSAGYSWTDPKVTAIMGVALKASPQRSHRVSLTTTRGTAVTDQGASWQRLRGITDAGCARVFGMVVGEDNSFVADGVIARGEETGSEL